MPSAQELVDEIEDDIDYDLDVSVEDDMNEVELELMYSIYQELTVPIEERDIYWAQTLIDSV
jgi:hypothetical protein